MVNSKSDLEPAPGLRASPVTKSSGLSADSLTKRVGISTNLSEKSAVLENGEESDDNGSVKSAYDQTHRKLKPRHIQLIGIGGTIGTALYVQIGKSLGKGGPGSLFLAFVIWSVLVLSIDMHLILALLLALVWVPLVSRSRERPRSLVSSWPKRPRLVEPIWFRMERPKEKQSKQLLPIRCKRLQRTARQISAPMQPTMASHLEQRA